MTKMTFSWNVPHTTLKRDGNIFLLISEAPSNYNFTITIPPATLIPSQTWNINIFHTIVLLVILSDLTRNGDVVLQLDSYEIPEFTTHKNEF